MIFYDSLVRHCILIYIVSQRKLSMYAKYRVNQSAEMIQNYIIFDKKAEFG